MVHVLLRRSLIVNFFNVLVNLEGEKMEHGRERTEFGGARGAENGVVHVL